MAWRIDLFIILSLFLVSSCVPNNESKNKKKQISTNSEVTVMLDHQGSSKDNGKDRDDKDKDKDDNPNHNPTDTIPPSLPGFASFNKFYNASNFPFQFTWGVSVDKNLSGYNYKICSTSDCRTSCKLQQSSLSTIPNGTITSEGVTEGINYACVQAFDKYKNITSFVNVGSFTVDTIAPTASTFNLQSSGTHKEFTNKTSISWLSGNANGASQMCLTNSQSFLSCNWMPLKTSGTYTLPSAEDGLKTVYLFYRDEALNVSKPISATIVLDQTAPSNVALSLSNSDANIIGGSDYNFDHYVIKFCDSPACSNVISSLKTKTTQFSLSEMIALNKTFYTAVYAIDLADNISNVTIVAYTPTPTTPTTPTEPIPTGPFNALVKDIAIGSTSICIALPGGKVKCVGYNKYGQLGYSSDIYRSLSDLPDAPTHNLGTDFEVAQLVTLIGESYCALSTKGEVKCWGINSGGSMGQGTSDSYLAQNPLTPTTVNVGTDRPVQISSGGESYCILTERGDVKCWGYNAFAQLGLGHLNNIGDDPGEMGSNLKAVNLGTNIKAIKVAAAGSYTCALLNTHQVKCWGLGALGDDTYRANTGPSSYIGSSPNDMGDNLRPVYLGEDAIDISANESHVCVILASGKAKCWGNNMYAQLGYEDNENRGQNNTTGSMTKLLPINFGSNKVLQIFAGPEYTCAILDNSETKCWGRNVTGNLGQEGRTTSLYYMRLSEVSNLNFGTGVKASKIYTSSFLSCGLMTNGKVKCWGQGYLINRGSNNDIGDQVNEMGDGLLYLEL